MKQQSTVREYELPRNAVKVKSPINSTLASQLSSPPIKEPKEALTDTVLNFDKFVYNNPQEIENSKNLNDKYYNGRNFDLRLKVDKNLISRDGSKIKVQPAKMLVSAYKNISNPVSFEIKYDKNRRNLNTNTVSFA